MENSTLSPAFSALFNLVKRELGIVSTKPSKKLKSESKVYPIESQCFLSDSYGYWDFKDPPFFPNSIECNNFVSRFMELKREYRNCIEVRFTSLCFVLVLLIFNTCNFGTCKN
jgi:hypothetical protein